MAPAAILGVLALLGLVLWARSRKPPAGPTAAPTPQDVLERLRRESADLAQLIDAAVDVRRDAIRAGDAAAMAAADERVMSLRERRTDVERRITAVKLSA